MDELCAAFARLAIKGDDENGPKSTSAFPFLRLPGELGNRIYEYVLSAPNGFVANAWTANPGGEEQFFCDTIPTWDILFCRQMLMRTSFQTEALPVLSRASPQPFTSSLYNQLQSDEFDYWPAYLREVIFRGYRLRRLETLMGVSPVGTELPDYITGPGRTTIVGRNMLPQPCLRATVDFNQLKYVSKQLYHETAGLEVKYNSIVFPPFHIGKLIRMNPSTFPWLNTVIVFGWCTCIKQHRYWHGQGRSILMCHAHTVRHISAMLSTFQQSLPNVKVKYIVPEWIITHVVYSVRHNPEGYYEHLPFAVTGAYFDMKLRGVDSTFMTGDGKYTGTPPGHIATVFDAASTDNPGPPLSVKLYPAVKGFSEKEIAEIRYDLLFDEAPEEVIELWLEKAKNWMENGI